GRRRDLFGLLSYPTVSLESLTPFWPQIPEFSARLKQQIETEAQYAVYLDRQRADIQAFKRDEKIALPLDLDFSQLSGISNEVCQKLKAARPATLGQASRIEGVTPAALTLLLAYIKRRGNAA
ncbi:MAG: tRNA uridine-5-carboxymethylaminomethyl(34) synthesis enzyme MnmG, partial [Hyphomicrobiales bacterium]